MVWHIVSHSWLEKFTLEKKVDGREMFSWEFGELLV